MGSRAFPLRQLRRFVAFLVRPEQGHPLLVRRRPSPARPTLGALARQADGPAAEPLGLRYPTRDREVLGEDDSAQLVAVSRRADVWRVDVRDVSALAIDRVGVRVPEGGTQNGRASCEGRG